MKMNGTATGKVERNTRRKTPGAPRQSEPPRRAGPGGSGSCCSRWCIAFELRRLQNRRDHGRQRVRDQPLRLPRVRGRAHGPEDRQVAPLLGQAAHEIEDPVDDAPGQVAAERADEHRADVLAPGLGHAQRTGEGQDHDQAEEHLGDALARFEHALADGWIAGRAVSAGSLRSGRQQVERHGEDQVDHQHSTPTNHAERPLLVTSEAVRVAMSIITTAPGQNCRSIGAGPMT